MRTRLEARLVELKRELADGERLKQQLQDRTSELDITMQRIGGAVQVLEELLEELLADKQGDDDGEDAS